MTNPPGEGPTQPDQPHEPQREQPDEPGYQPGQPQPGQPQPGQPQPGQPQPGQSPPGHQPGYWEQQAQQQRQQPPYPPPGYPAQAPIQYAPDHPRATTSLVMGILGVVLCQVLAPFAWVMGKRTLDEIDAAQGQLGGRGAAQAGYILGIVGTVILGISLVFLVFYVILMVAVIGGGIASS